MEKDKDIRLADAPDHIQGNKQLDGESREEYKERKRREKKIMGARLKYGISRFQDPNRKPMINYRKQVAKKAKAAKKASKKS